MKKKWRAIADIAHKNVLLLSLVNFADGSKYISSLASEMLSLIETYFKPNPHITIENIQEEGYKHLAIALTDCILGNKPPDLPKTSGRIIGLGALGRISRKIVPDLLGTPLEPTALWDCKASLKVSIAGVPVTLSDFESLTSEDVVLIFPQRVDIKQELSGAVRSRGVERIFFYSDIYKLLTQHKYQQFYNECEFVW